MGERNEVVWTTLCQPPVVNNYSLHSLSRSRKIQYLLKTFVISNCLSQQTFRSMCSVLDALLEGRRGRTSIEDAKTTLEPQMYCTTILIACHLNFTLRSEHNLFSKGSADQSFYLQLRARSKKELYFECNF